LQKIELLLALAKADGRTGSSWALAGGGLRGSGDLRTRLRDAGGRGEQGELKEVLTTGEGRRKRPDFEVDGAGQFGIQTCATTLQCTSGEG
jgi:hypothetical protein